MRTKVIRDSIHGDMSFAADELALIDSAAFQRLRGIKQLGTSYLVYPSATHTRFEHSLGVCWMAKRILHSVAANGDSSPVSEEVERLVSLGALLHDITHIPFGHTFEDERRVLPRHDESEERLDYYLAAPKIGEVVSRMPGLKPLLLKNVLSQDEPSAFPREVVSGTVCADLLDYLRRDACHCGLHQDYDERLFRYMRMIDGHLVIDLQHGGIFRPDALSELTNLLRLRYNLTERVYYHHAKVSSGAMVSKALEIALNEGGVKKEELLDLRDDSFLFLLHTRCAGLPPVQGIMNDLLARQLFVRAYLLCIESPESPGIGVREQTLLADRFHTNENSIREHTELAIEKELGLPGGSVLIYCPSTRMALQEADVLVRLPNSDITPLSGLQLPEVEVLQDKHRKLWRFYVFLRRSHAQLAGRCARVCEEIIGFPNMLPQSRTR